MFNTYRVDLVAALADLYAGQLTFGDVAKFRAKQTADLRNSVAAIEQGLQAKRAAEVQARQDAAAQKAKEDAQSNAQLAAIERQRAAEQRQLEAQQMYARQQEYARQQAMQQQQEEARRQAALMILLNQRPIQPYQIPLPPNPTTTNCYAIGNQWTCRTN